MSNVDIKRAVESGKPIETNNLDRHSLFLC